MNVEKNPNVGKMMNISFSGTVTRLRRIEWGFVIGKYWFSASGACGGI